MNLIQGNSTEYFKKKLDEEVSLVLTSPSYFTDTPKRIKLNNEIGVGETKESYVKLITDVINDISINFNNNSTVVLVIGRYNDLPIKTLSLMIENSLNSLNLVGYKEFGKNNCEAIMVLKNNSENIEIPEFDSLQEYKKVGFFGQIRKEILDWAITNFSLKDELVVDPFAGAGSTLKAAEQLKRNTFGVELNPEYIK